MIVHFNRLKRYLRRPPQLQPTLPDVERDAGQPTDLNVGQRAVLELPWARTADALPGDPAPTENAAAVNREHHIGPPAETFNQRPPRPCLDGRLSFREGH